MKAVFLKKSTLNYFYSYSVSDETCYDCEHMKCLPIMLLLWFLFSLQPNSSQHSHVLSLALWTKPLLCLSFRSLIWMIFVTHSFPRLTLKFCPSLTDFFCTASVCKDFCVSFEQTKILFYGMDKFSLLYSCLCIVLYSCLLLCALSCASSDFEALFSPLPTGYLFAIIPPLKLPFNQCSQKVTAVTLPVYYNTAYHNFFFLSYCHIYHLVAIRVLNSHWHGMFSEVGTACLHSVYVYSPDHNRLLWTSSSAHDNLHIISSFKLHYGIFPILLFLFSLPNQTVLGYHHV